jgi:hypothetical protein
MNTNKEKSNPYATKRRSTKHKKKPVNYKFEVLILGLPAETEYSELYDFIDQTVRLFELDVRPAYGSNKKEARLKLFKNKTYCWYIKHGFKYKDIEYQTVPNHLSREVKMQLKKERLYLYGLKSNTTR